MFSKHTCRVALHDLDVGRYARRRRDVPVVAAAIAVTDLRLRLRREVLVALHRGLVGVAVVGDFAAALSSNSGLPRRNTRCSRRAFLARSARAPSLRRVSLKQICLSSTERRAASSVSVPVGNPCAASAYPFGYWIAFDGTCFETIGFGTSMVAACTQPVAPTARTETREIEARMDVFMVTLLQQEVKGRGVAARRSSAFACLASRRGVAFGRA